MKLNERIKIVIKQTKMSLAEFERKAGLTRDRIAGVLSRDSDKFSSEVLVAICTTYNVNPAWLLLEEGSMYRDGVYTHPSIIDAKPINNVEDASKDLYKQLYEEYKNMVVAKDARISELEKQLSEKDKQYKESEREFHLTIRQLARQYSPASAVPSPTVNPTPKSGIGEAKLHRDLK